MSVFQVRTGDRVTDIGHGASFLIAECCNNFQGSIGIAEEMIEAARVAGAHAVKFQHRGRLTFDQLQHLRTRAIGAGLHFLCTGYSTDGQDDLIRMGLVQTLKIGSAEESRQALASVASLAAFIRARADASKLPA